MPLFSLRLMLCLFVCISITQLVAQQKKIVIVPFYGTQHKYNEAAQLVYDMVLTTCFKSNRATFLEREGFDRVIAEKIFQASEDVSLSETIDFDAGIGATHLIIGKVTQHETTYKRPEGGGNGYYTCRLQTVIRVVNIETGKIEAAEIWNNGGELLCFNTGENAATATQKTVNCQKKEVRNFLAKFLPLTATIKKWQSDREVIISLGSSDGIKKGEKLEVFSLERIDGDVFKKKIGELRVMEVNGPKLSTAIVKRGESDIKLAQSSRQELLIQTK